MLMPRLPYHPTNGYSPGMSISLIMQHQQQHISQLLNTAATGTGIVGDVDALLTPIQNDSPTPARSDVGRERNLWRTNEIMEVLKIMQEINALEMLNVKTVKSELIFRKVERIMFQRGFRKKSHVQIWTKWKFLKSTYSTSRRSGIIPKMIPQMIYDELHKMLQNANNTSNSGRSTSNCGNSATSLDGDNSNVDAASSGSLNDSQLIISGVEGGYDGRNNSLDGLAGVGGESDEENGLAHPIFGFRLGLVKQEPTDTGYETPNKAKEKDTTANIQFQTEIKQEINDGSDSPVATVASSPQPPLEEATRQKRQSAPEIMILSRRVATPTAKDHTNTNKASPTISATSTPNGITTSSSQTRPGSADTTTAPTQKLPPLRIAPFAKVPQNDVATPAANLPPPPLAMNPASNALRLNSAYSSNAYAMADKRNAAMNARNSGTPPTMLNYQRRLISNHLLKPQTTSQAVTVSTRLPPVLEPSYMQRQEVVAPDMDGAAAPHEYHSAQPFYGFPDGPSTSQQAQQQFVENRKRRLAASQLMSTIPPKRMQRQTETYANRLTPRQAAFEFGGGEDYDEDYQTGYEEEEQRTPKAFTYNANQRPNTNETSGTDRERNQTYSRVLQDMALSLRQMQREVINEFFKRQMKLAREEHEFQKQQDEMLMQAFKEQAMQFQQMGKQLMGSAVKIEKRKKRLEKQARKQMLDNEMKQVPLIQAQGKKATESTKVMSNGLGGKPKQEHNKGTDEDDQRHLDEDDNEDGIQFLMRNVHAQLDLSEDDNDDNDANASSNEPHQYEYDINEYASQGYAGADGEQESTDAIDAQESASNNLAEAESDEESEYASENMEIIGH